MRTEPLQATLDSLPKLQSALDAIKKVCEEHGVLLIGSALNEGQYGEIGLVFKQEHKDEIQDERITNKLEVFVGCFDDFVYVNGIG